MQKEVLATAPSRSRVSPIAARGTREEKITTEQLYFDLGTRDADLHATPGYKLATKIANLEIYGSREDY